MPAQKGNTTSRRSPEATSKSFMVRLTPKERIRWQELADCLQLDVSQMARSAVEDYRMRAILGGAKLKK